MQPISPLLPLSLQNVAALPAFSWRLLVALLSLLLCSAGPCWLCRPVVSGALPFFVALPLALSLVGPCLALALCWSCGLACGVVPSPLCISVAVRSCRAFLASGVAEWPSLVACLLFLCRLFSLCRFFRGLPGETFVVRFFWVRLFRALAGPVRSFLSLDFFGEKIFPHMEKSHIIIRRDTKFRPARRGRFFTRAIFPARPCPTPDPDPPPQNGCSANECAALPERMCENECSARRCCAPRRTNVLFFGAVNLERMFLERMFCADALPPAERMFWRGAAVLCERMFSFLVSAYKTSQPMERKMPLPEGSGF